MRARGWLRRWCGRGWRIPRRGDHVSAIYGDLAHRGREHPIDIGLEKQHDHRRQRDVACLAALGVDAAQPPIGVELPHAEGGDRLAPHTRVAQDQKDRHVARALALLGRVDQRVHQLRARHLTRRRPFVRVPVEVGRPDGLTVDSEGAVWVALNEGGAVHRYTPQGVLDEVVELPVPKVTACTFGGPRLDELFITTSREGLEPGTDPLAGSLFRAVVGIAGKQAAEFAG